MKTDLFYRILQARTKANILKDKYIQNRIVEIEARNKQGFDIQGDLYIIEGMITKKESQNGTPVFDFVDLLKTIDALWLLTKKERRKK